MKTEMNIFEFLHEKYVLPKKVRLFETFAGIGCQRMAFNRLGIEVEMVGISEIDKYAIKSYMAIHGETKNWGSICDVRGQDLPDIDVFTYSFPCTDLSKAGKQKGLSQTRSGLVYEVLRILHEMTDLPKVLIMENVVDLVQSKFIRQFNEIQAELESLGYTNYAETMNAKDFGVAQNRDRIFMVSVLGSKYYEFPKPFTLTKRLKDYLEYKVEEKYYLTNTSLKGLTDALERHGNNLNEIVDNEKELSVIQYPRGENSGGLISDKTSPTIDGAIGARNTAVICVKEKNYGAVDEKYYLSDNFIKGMTTNSSPKYDRASRFNGAVHKNVDEAIGWIIQTTPGSRPTDNFIQVKENNSTGYDIAIEGDCININQPNSKTRRGRVGHQISQTLTTQQELVVIEPKCLNYTEPLAYDEQNKYIRQDGCVGTLTTDGSSPKHNNRVIEPVCLNSKVDGKQPSLQDRVCDSEAIATAVTTGFMPSVTEPIIYDDYNQCVRSDQSTMGTLTTNIGNDARRNGYKLIEPKIIDDTYKGRDERVYDSCSPSLRSEREGLKVDNGIRIRKLTPLECWRLMGIDDTDFVKASQVCSNSQLYKQAGNGIVVDVFAEILRTMKGDV